LFPVYSNYSVQIVATVIDADKVNIIVGPSVEILRSFSFDTWSSEMLSTIALSLSVVESHIVQLI